jgi:hypothetical protein
MKKTLVTIALTIAMLVQPFQADADGDTIIFGKFVDANGFPLGDLSFYFAFADKTNAYGRSKADGSFLLTGPVGDYRFSLTNNYGQPEKCITTSFKGNFANARENFTLVFPRKSTYGLQVLDSKARSTFGASWAIENAKFVTPSNPDFGDPKFTCQSTYGRGTGPTQTTTVINTYELDLASMSDEGGSLYSNSKINATYLDSIQGNKTIAVPLSAFSSTQLVISAPNLPTLELVASSTKPSKSQLTVLASLYEPAHLLGVGVPREVKVMWRYKSPSKGAKWSSWRYGPETVAKPDGKISSTFKLVFNHPLKMKPGIKIEHRVIGVDFGSMSELKTLTIK